MRQARLIISDREYHAIAEATIIVREMYLREVHTLGTLSLGEEGREFLICLLRLHLTFL